MSAHCYFLHVQHTDDLENFLRSKIEAVTSHFIPDDRYNLITRVMETRTMTDRKNPKFLCEIRLESPHYTSSIVIKKKSFNFYHAASQVGEVLAKLLRREAAEKHHHHRREHRRFMRQLHEVES